MLTNFVSFLCVINFVFIYINMYAQELTVFEAINTSLKNNQTIMYSANKNIQTAQLQLESSHVLYNPTLDFNVNYSRSLTKNKFPIPYPGYSTSEFQQFLPSLSLQKTFLTPLGSRLTLGGGVQSSTFGISYYEFETRPYISLYYQQPLSASGINAGHASIKQAEYSYQRAQLQYESQTEDLVLSVIQSYFQLWQAEKSLEQNELTLESTKRMLAIGELKLKSGNIAESEVLNLQVQYRLALDQLLVARNNLKNQRISFNRLLGIDINIIPTLSDSIPLDSIKFSLDEAFKSASEKRIDLKQSEINMYLSELSKSQTISAYMPVLNLNASLNYRSMYESTFFNSFNFPNNNWNINAGISFPLLSGGRKSLQKEIAEKNIDVTKKNHQLLNEKIMIDIENYYRNLQLNKRRIVSLQLSFKAAAEALAITELKFHSGQISSLEIESVRNRYNSAQNSLNSAKISYITERAQLAKEMGNLMDWILDLKDMK